MDWERFWIIIFILGIATGLMLLIAEVLDKEEQQEVQKQAFMDECIQYKKQYECTVLWRSSNPDSTTVVPMPMPMPIYMGK